MYKILLLGSGGREHTFALKIAESKKCSALFIAPGNAGTSHYGQNVPINPLDFDAVAQFVRKNAITMVVVGPEEPLVRGIWDYFKAQADLKEVLLIGPSQEGAMLEGSKAWAKAFMGRYGIPTASYREFTSETAKEAVQYIESHPLPVVLKADGLAAGKGVVIAQQKEAAKKEIKAMLSGKFGDASATVVVEQFLTGIEFSVFVLTDGKNYKILPEAKDYKRIKDGDKGPNTGGMGAVSPVPFADETLWQKVEQSIIIPTVNGLRKEKINYQGFIFFGLIVVKGEPFVIEYNCRMGDPETEVVFPRIKNDLVDLMEACAKGRLKSKTIRTAAKAATTVMLVSGGYPGDYEKGKKITGLDATKNCLVLHAGTKIAGEDTVTNGGRVIAVTALGKTIPDALKKSYRNARKIKFEGRFFRKDIGKDLL
jgi:phosphoribosylamine---glycine ligase